MTEELIHRNDCMLDRPTRQIKLTQNSGAYKHGQLIFVTAASNLPKSSGIDWWVNQDGWCCSGVGWPIYSDQWENPA